VSGERKGAYYIYYDYIYYDYYFKKVTRVPPPSERQ
jgi:hypothetical protein